MSANHINTIQRESEITELLDSILSVLQKEIEVYKELHSIINAERDALKKPRLPIIHENNSKKETCILKAKMLEQVRGQVVKKIGRLIEVADEDINISLLSSLADEERGGAFREKQRVLGQLMTEIKEVNERNRGLIDFSLSYVKNSINFINNLISAGADYGRTGQLKSDGLYGRIVNREG